MKEKKLKILAIETSSRSCEVALSANGRSWYRKEQGDSHSNIILALIQNLFEQAELHGSELDFIAVTRGPGSFTGLRIGIAVAQALAFANSIPVLPVSTLKLQAWAMLCGNLNVSGNSLNGCSVLSTLDARMQQLYAAWYQISENDVLEAGCEQLVTPAEFSSLGIVEQSRAEGNECYVLGSGLDYRAEIPEQCLSQLTIVEGICPSADALLSYSLHLSSRCERLPFVSPELLAPIYIRNKVTG